MRLKKTLKLLIIPVLISFLLTLLVYGSLPEQISTHWDASGDADMSRPRFILLLTSLLPGLFIFFLAKLNHLHTEQNDRVYSGTSIFLVIFLIGFHWYIIFGILGFLINLSMLIRVMIALLFLLTGKYLLSLEDRVRFSIQTPWTLEHDEVWLSTQRFGGKMFVIMGLLLLVTLFTTGATAFFILAAAVLVIISSLFIYSHKRERAFKSSISSN
jgi:uncharacterized membrane protein